jgi:hypothetical protein
MEDRKTIIAFVGEKMPDGSIRDDCMNCAAPQARNHSCYDETCIRRSSGDPVSDQVRFLAGEQPEEKTPSGGLPNAELLVGESTKTESPTELDRADEGDELSSVTAQSSSDSESTTTGPPTGTGYEKPRRYLVPAAAEGFSRTLPPELRLHDGLPIKTVHPSSLSNFWKRLDDIHAPFEPSSSSSVQLHDVPEQEPRLDDTSAEIDQRPSAT